MLVLEKLPLFTLAAASSIVTLVVQRSAMGSVERYALGARLANAIVSYGKYLLLMVWPRGLAVFYPHPRQALPAWHIASAIALLAALSVLALRLGRRRPYLLVGWLWYLLTLVPVIGLVQVGGQSMADRYTYIPLIGPFLMLAWGVPDLLDVLRGRVSGRTSAASPSSGATAASPSGRATARSIRYGKASESGSAWSWSAGLMAAGIMAVLALAAAARVQTTYWRDSVTLFEHAVTVTENNHIAEGQLGTAYFERGEIDKAIAHFEESLRIAPEYADAHGNLAAALLKQGKIDEAMAHSREALRAWPSHPRSHTNLGLAYMLQGRLEEAAQHLRDALRIAPDFIDARLNLGVVLAQQGKLDDAIAEFSAVLRIDPNDRDARESLDRAIEAKRRGKRF